MRESGVESITTGATASVDAIESASSAAPLWRAAFARQSLRVALLVKQPQNNRLAHTPLGQPLFYSQPAIVDPQLRRSTRVDQQYRWRAKGVFLGTLSGAGIDSKLRTTRKLIIKCVGA